MLYMLHEAGVFFFFYFFLSKKHFLYVYICAYIKKKKKNLSPLAFRDRLAGWFWGIDLTGRERGRRRGGSFRRFVPAVRSGGAQPLCEGRQARGHGAAVWACRCVRVCA